MQSSISKRNTKITVIPRIEIINLEQVTKTNGVKLNSLFDTTMYLHTQWELKSPVKTAGPKLLAGFMLAPVKELYKIYEMFLNI